MKINILVKFERVFERIAFLDTFGSKGLWESHDVKGGGLPKEDWSPLPLYIYKCDKEWAESFFGSIPSKNVREMTPDEVADFLRYTPSIA